MVINLDMLEELWDELWIISKEQRTVTYSELQDRMYQRGYVFRSFFLKPYLIKVTQQCIENSVPILTSLVVQDTNRIPHDYYFIAQRACRETNKDDFHTWRVECESVWTEWK